jgi:membrane protease YdiL (CAAX protease family)
VFALLHLFLSAAILAVAVFIPSLIFGYFRDRYEQLHAPILLHIFYNAGYIWLFSSIPNN